MTNRGFIESLNNAVEGLLHVLKEERNMRVHFLFGFLLLLFGVFLDLGRTEWIILCLTVTFVLFAEMMNTAVEEIADLIQASYHPKIRKIKDIAAGAVLVSVFNSLVVGYFIFSRHWHKPFEAMFTEVRRTPWQITFVAVVGVTFLVIAGKAFFHKGTPLRGGMPSGHAAFAFSLWTTLIFVQNSLFVSAVGLSLAVLVAHSRIQRRIHSIWEVCCGALLGFLVTALLFQLFFHSSAPSA